MNTPASNRDAVSFSRQAAGFSLVEIMVALVAGLLLSAGIGQVYLATKKTYKVQEQMSRLQENARYALSRISRDISMAGSVGCTSRTPNTIVNTLNDSANLFYNFATRIQGFEAMGTSPTETYSITATNPAPSGATTQWSPRLPAETPDTILGSDLLVVRGRVDEGAPPVLAAVTPDLATASAAIANLEVGDFVMVADCGTSYVFQAGSAGAAMTHTNAGTPGNAVPTWAYNTPPSSLALPGNAPAEVSKVASTLYYLSRRDDHPEDGPSFYGKSIDSGTNTHGEGLVEGVESMQVLYGVNTGATIQYLTAPDVDALPVVKGANGWNQVVSVRIGLLVRTVDEVRSDMDTQVYDVNGTFIDPVDDRRLRQVFTTTIAVRNGIQTQ